LSARLGWRLCVLLFVAIVLAAGAIVWRTVATVHELDDQALQSQARLIAATLPAKATAPVSIPHDLIASFQASDGDNVFLVYRGDELVSTSDPAAAARMAPFLKTPPSPGFFRLPVVPGRLHGMIGLTVAAGAWQVVVMQGREQTSVLLESLTGNFIAGAFFLLLPIGLLAILVAVMTLRRGLRPLRQVSAAARRVGPAQPGARLPTIDLPDEVFPLVQTVNDALSRLDQALLGQRRFMAEAAHALRTPLAVLTARLDMMEDQQGLDGLRHDADRMGRLVGQLLRMARLENMEIDVSSAVSLHDVAVEAITALVPIGLRKGVEIALVETTAEAPLHGNHATLVLAVTNLIENALAYAPRGSTVEVVVGERGRITVLDEGPGIPPGERDHIFERFVRGPHADEGGAGLGLAIVAEIALAHHGAAWVEDRPEGGSAFVLDLKA
jgi:signal transduction histidine kinase